MFLLEITVFQCFNYEGYCFLPKGTQVIIELENVIESNLSKMGFSKDNISIPENYHVLKILQEEGDEKYI